MLAQRRHEFWRPSRQGRRVGAFQGELVLRAADRVVEGQVLNGLHVQRDAADIRGLAFQPPDHIVHGGGTISRAVSS